MAETREFKPLKEIGTLVISDSSELKFYIDEYKGYKYGSVRTFVKGDNYSGPTKSGVTMNPAIVEGLIGALSQLPADPQTLAEKELARFPKRMGIELVLRITIFKDSTGIDLREWVEDRDYKGWSKKGVRIPYKDLPKALDFFKEMQRFVAKP